jgi:hypothetical protein
MEQNKFEKILHSLYPDLKVMDYTLFERYDIGENGQFENKMNLKVLVLVLVKILVV